MEIKVDQRLEEILNILNKIEPTRLSYSVAYYLYKVPKEKQLQRPNQHFLSTEAKRGGGVCFAGLYRALESKACNTLFYGLDHNCVEKEVRKEWVDVMVCNKFLPSYVTMDNAENRELILDINDPQLSPSLLYVYLSVWRCMREEQAFVKGFLKLYKDYNINPFLAWIIASSWFVEGSGHNITGVYRLYGIRERELSTMPFQAIIGLKRYITEPRKYDKRPVKCGGCFETIKHVNNAAKEFENKHIILRDIFDENVKNILAANSEEEAKLMNKLPKRAKNTAYYRR